MASSASGQDDPYRVMWLATRAGTMEPSCPLGTTRCIAQEKFPRKPYNKSFIDQVCSVKMAGYWPGYWFILCEFMDLDFVSVHNHAKKRTWPISSHLDLTLGKEPIQMNQRKTITLLGNGTDSVMIIQRWCWAVNKDHNLQHLLWPSVSDGPSMSQLI